MSMISDKERSEVAKAFRSVAKVIKRREGSGMPDLCAAWMALSTAITGRIAFCNTSDVFDALADLIGPSFHCDEHIVDDFVASKTDLVPKAYVVSVLSSKYKIPRWLYSNREAAEKKANEYIKEEHNALFDDDSIEWAVVNEVEVIA